MARILGALVIVRALAPLVLLVAFTTASVGTVRAISRAASAYRDQVRREVDTARAAFARANEGLTVLGAYATGVKQAVDRVAADVARVASRITVPLPDGWPTISMQIPGVPQFKEVVRTVAAAGRILGREVDKVTALGGVPAQLTAISAATGDFAGAVRSAVARWIALVVGVTALAVALWLLGSAARVVSDVARGWALLRGAAHPSGEGADLRRRLEDLERQVAALRAGGA